MNIPEDGAAPGTAPASAPTVSSPDRPFAPPGIYPGVFAIPEPKPDRAHAARSGPASLAGLPIIITGASSGIGRATAIACARAGMPVVACARRSDRLAELVREIEGAGGKAVAVECDVADWQACIKALSICLKRFGSVYAVFANAGYGVEQPVHAMRDDELRRMFEVNLFGSMNIIRAALIDMFREKRGHILWCSSCLARLPMTYYGAYTATKAAQHHLARAMRAELEPMGIAVSSIHPVGTRTEFFEVAAKGGNGLSSNSPEMFMQSADFVAERIVRCLRRPRAEVWPGFTGFGIRWLAALSTGWVGLSDRMCRVAKRTADKRRR